MQNVLPETGFVRAAQLLGNPKANPPIPPILPIKKTTLWKWVADGKLPKPIRLSKGVTVWRASDIRDFLANAKPDDDDLDQALRDLDADQALRDLDADLAGRRKGRR
ncbi:MAG: AlpA family phage regulatory protein [Zoogloeaceae bacterium]|jgi:predicted DNA-binding transcriptional regulator AlpA|nr:AlpA family phage regulatory protein [Zoogloeaceae bacterium]